MNFALRICLFLLSFAVVQAQDARFFPQVGYGTIGSLGLRTTIVLANTGLPAEAVLDFFAGDGQPLEVELTSLGKATSFTVPLVPGQTVTLETPGAGEPTIGYARMIAPVSVDGTAVFTGLETSSGTILFEAGVPASRPLESFTVALDSLATRNTGLALLAPPATPAATGIFTMILYDESFRRVAARDIPISSGQQIARYIDQFFEDPATVEAAREMRGSVSVMSDLPLAAVTLRQMLTEPFPLAVPTLTTFPVIQEATYPKSSDWRKVWEDEFDGTDIDPAKWEYQLGGTGWGNNELQYYTGNPENARVENGRLKIIARKENYGGRQYTSARLRTREKGDWRYGRFEIRARLPRGKGIWPAIWMMPTDDVYGTWAASGEIDIMEFLGHEINKVYGTLHYGGEYGKNRSSGKDYVLPAGNFCDSFHEFVLEWEPGVMRWYVDDYLFSTQTSWDSLNARKPAPFPAPFDQRFHMILNLAVGGNWPGSPDASTQFPQELEVEYVRVYQRR
jgi:beta-glucanase (GH16 family)